MPQVRGDTAFYPSALEKGLRSEQALKLAMAEMYVQGVSTRKVSAIVEELCGTAVSSTQVSACAKLLDAELQKWRARPLGACPYLVFDARYEKVRHEGQFRDCAVLSAPPRFYGLQVADGGVRTPRPTTWQVHGEGKRFAVRLFHAQPRPSLAPPKEILKEPARASDVRGMQASAHLDTVERRIRDSLMPT